MIAIHDAMNAEELAKSIELLSSEIDRLRSAGPMSISDVQLAGSSLTRAQLVLNELERIEIRERGVSREMAERFAELDGRIRAVRYGLFLDLTNRRPSAGAKGGGDAHDPAG